MEDQSVQYRPIESSAAYWLCAFVAVLLALDAIVGLLVPGVYHDSPGWAAQARGVNLIDLFLAVPALVISMALARRGSRRAVLVWIGVLGYVLYNSAIFTFDIAFNRLFLVYVGLLALAVFGSVYISRAIEPADLASRFWQSTPVLSVSVYLVAVAALFLLAWMKDIIPAVVTDTTPPNVLQAQIPTNPVYVLDLGFLIPLHVLAAVWLLRARAAGYVVAGALLVLNLLLSLSIISSTLFQYAIDPSISLAIVPVFAIIALASLLLTIVYLRAMNAGSTVGRLPRKG
jgi:hypothetical protein